MKDVNTYVPGTRKVVDGKMSYVYDRHESILLG